MSFENRMEYLSSLKENPDQYAHALKYLEKSENHTFEAELELKSDGKIPLDFYSLLGGGGDLSLGVQTASLYRWFLWTRNPDSYRLPKMVCFGSDWEAASSLKVALGKLLPGFNLKWIKGKISNFTFLELSEKG